MIWLTTLAFAQETSSSTSDLDLGWVGEVDPGVAPVVGGHPAREGKWNDAVGIVLASAYVGCTGTLIGPRTVLTAGHCVTGYPVTHVIIGSTDWYTQQGELIEVSAVHEYPNSQSSYDVALLELAEASTYEPRAIALECVLQDNLDDGAPVQIVGYGATSRTGGGFNTKLNEAATQILDKNCSEDFIGNVVTTCHDSLRPGGELVAGEFDEISVCYGDSGGPLYLKTDDGDFVVGVASRLILGPDFYSEPCSNGGVWVRPDAVMDWIEDTVGAKKVRVPSCNAPPAASAETLVTYKGYTRSTTVAVTDADGDAGEATLAIVVEPEHGKAAIEGREIRYTPDAGYVGPDELTVAVTDAGNPEWERTGDPATVELVVPIEVRKTVLGMAVGCETAPGAGVGLLGAILLFARRRR